MTENILKEVIGLSELEVKTYFILHNLGTQPASIVARKTGCPRSSIYAVLDKLIKEGLVTYTVRGGMKHFSSLSLKTLDTKLKEKQDSLCNDIKKIKENRGVIKEYLRCRAEKNEHSFLHTTPKMQIARGKEGIKSLCSLIEYPQKKTLKLWVGCSDQLVNPGLKKLIERSKVLQIISSDHLIIESNLITERKNCTVVTVSELHMPQPDTTIILTPQKYIYLVLAEDRMYGLIMNDQSFIKNQTNLFNFVFDQHVAKKQQVQSYSQCME